ncbi:unnamed protein product [Phytophthora fragariaefolia]|uniref:Unnamed protein product n=1 Tax=Phytophthora fragariaefolia TaxID=1490495 RepID=A0A9W6X146_9STRA|nr:unnamed protein product [Phytophthora fragariaefolia]
MFTLTADDWSVYKSQSGSGFNQVAENGEFVVAIHPDTDCDVYNDVGITNALCANFTLEAVSATTHDITSSLATKAAMVWWSTGLSFVAGLILS